MKQARLATVVLAKLYFFCRRGSVGLYVITTREVPESGPLQVITAVWKRRWPFILIRCSSLRRLVLAYGGLGLNFLPVGAPSSFSSSTSSIDTLTS